MDTESAYNQALDYLYSFVDYSLKHASELAKADFNLERMRELMAALGNPQDAYPTIHVAGTKGKGSVAALCASALQAAGYKTGLYTSPHLQDFCERIQIDGEPIPHAELAALVEEIKPAVAQVAKLTTFEITTALAFLYFARSKANAAVIEVGLGGRLDATNIITPCVSVITSLSYDHTAVLGETLTLIAGEKAGIIKPGVPVISSPQKDEALAVLEKVSAERGCELTLVGQDMTFKLLEHSLDKQSFEIMDEGGRMKNEKGGHLTHLNIPLLGTHQVENAVTAYAALKASGLEVSDEAIRKGFAEVRWPGRFEIVSRKPLFVIDSAHNRESAEKLHQTLDDYFPGKSVIWIFAILEDKDASGMLEELAPRITKIIATQPDHPRALETEKLIQLAQKAGIQVEEAKSTAGALERSLELAGEDGLTLSAGSVAFAGEMRTVWENHIRKSVN